MPLRSPVILLLVSSTSYLVVCNDSEREPPITTPAVVTTTPPAPASGSRMMPDLCRFNRQAAASLEEGLDVIGAVERRWPANLSITWTAAAPKWLNNATADEQSEATLDLVRGSASDIIGYLPGPRASSACEARVEFNAELDIHTIDGIIDGRARGRFIARRETTAAALRLTMDPARFAEPGRAEATIEVALELPNTGDQAAKIEILSRASSVESGRNGRGTVKSAVVVLGSNVAPFETPSLSPLAWLPASVTGD